MTAFGIVIMVAWLTHATAVLHFANKTTPMFFNTALALTLTGICLFAVTRGKPKAAIVAGAFDAVLGVLCLTEYIVGRNLGIDQLFVRAYMNAPGHVPGRMGANTAACLVLFGAGFLLWRPWRPNPHPVALMACASAAGAIVVVAFFGYASQNAAAYGWNQLSAMAEVTAVVMGVGAVAMVAAAWDQSVPRPGGLPAWLAIPLSVVAFGFCAFVWWGAIGAAGQSGRISTNRVIVAATILGLAVSGLFALSIGLAQRLDERRRLAELKGVQLAKAEAEARARESEVRALNEHLEDRVERRTADLVLANANLEAFTYSVAHDLRAPLRAMSGFSEALLEEYADRLDEGGREYATRIESASQRMAELIDDLLHLSRVSRGEIHLEPVDLSREVASVAQELQNREPDRQVNLVIEDGVWVTADRLLIHTVVENLIGNAWKFTSHRTKANIEFGTTPDGPPICCFVRDNGAGFDPTYADKLFQPFQRLHQASEFPGTGVGLASVLRIVERHGGRTWAEGAVDQGATFYFTLDAKEPK
jgi:signal transduction histidine kinase